MVPQACHDCFPLLHVHNFLCYVKADLHPQKFPHRGNVQGSHTAHVHNSWRPSPAYYKLEACNTSGSRMHHANVGRREIRHTARVRESWQLTRSSAVLTHCKQVDIDCVHFVASVSKFRMTCRFGINISDWYKYLRRTSSTKVRAGWRRSRVHSVNKWLNVRGSICGILSKQRAACCHRIALQLAGNCLSITVVFCTSWNSLKIMLSSYKIYMFLTIVY
jgi:hypothetical protein